VLHAALVQPLRREGGLGAPRLRTLPTRLRAPLTAAKTRRWQLRTCSTIIISTFCSTGHEHAAAQHAAAQHAAAQHKFGTARRTRDCLNAPCPCIRVQLPLKRVLARGTNWKKPYRQSQKGAHHCLTLPHPQSNKPPQCHPLSHTAHRRRNDDTDSEAAQLMQEIR